jgi:hypothetical protein
VNADGQTEHVEDEPMQTIDHHQERFAPERMLGLMAQLSLPELRGADGVYRKPRIEVEVTPGKWEMIDSVAIDDEKIIFSFGVNGHRKEWTFLQAEGCPPWRRVRPETLHGLGVGCA